MRDFNPIKMYCHKDVVDLVRDDVAGKYLHFFWDDFKMWINKDIIPRKRKHSIKDSNPGSLVGDTSSIPE